MNSQSGIKDAQMGERLKAIRAKILLLETDALDEVLCLVQNRRQNESRYHFQLSAFDYQKLMQLQVS